MNLNRLALSVTLISALSANFANAQSCDTPATEITPSVLARCSGVVAGNPGSVSQNAPTDIATIFNTTGAVTATFAAGLLTHPLNAHATQTRISTGNTPGITAVDFNNGNTTLFGVVNGSATITRAFGTIDRATGNFTPAASFTGVAAADAIADLTIDPSNGTGYLVTNVGTPPTATANLYRLNTATGVATLVGPISTTNFITGIAANCAGEVYAHDIVADTLLRVNTTTGLGTVVGPTGYNANFSQGMDFDNSANTLYGWALGGAAGAFTYQFGSFNLTTGALSNDSATPASQVKGAIPTACAGAVPPAPVIPTGTSLNLNVGTSTPVGFTGAGSVSCTVTGPFTATPNPLTSPGTVTLTATGAGTGTLTCVSGATTIATYPLRATLLVATPSLNLWGAMGLLLALSAFGVVAVRRFS